MSTPHSPLEPASTTLTVADAGTPASPAAPVRKSRAGRNLPAAIGVGVGLVAVVVSTLLWFNWGFVAFTALALALGAVELHRALLRLDMRSSIIPIVVGTVVIVMGAYAAGRVHGATLPSNTWLVASLGMTVLAALIWRMPKGAAGFVRDAAASLFIIAYLPLLGSFVALIMAGTHGALRMVSFIACVVANDIGGYIAGVLFGRHPMAPRISPKKTWEGFAGSVVAGMAVGMFCTTQLLHVSWWAGVLLGALLVGFGTAGDLVESLVKRDVGIKDMSHFLPGHGGVMDRLDSLLVAAPVAWLVMYLTVPGG